MEIQGNYQVVLLPNTKYFNFILRKKQRSQKRMIFCYCELYSELYFAILNTEIRFKQEQFVIRLSVIQ